MAVTIKLKNASGSDPSASDLVVGEVAVRTDNGKLFTKKDDGSVAEISGGGGGIDDGDKGDITVSNSGATFTIDNGVISTAKIADEAVSLAKLEHGTVNNNGKFLRANNGADPTFETITQFVASNVIGLFDQGGTPVQRLLASTEGVTVQGTSGAVSKLMFRDRTTANFLKFKPVDTLSADVEFTLPSADGSANHVLKTDGSGVMSFGTIVNASIASNAAIAGTKIDPDFGSQNIDTSGNITSPVLVAQGASGSGDGIILVNSGGGQNNDFSRIRQDISDDSFIIENKSSGSYESFFKGNSSRGAELHFQGNKKLETLTGGVSVTGNITVSGTVDGRDLATDGSKLDGIAAGATNVTNTNQLTNGAGFLTSVGTSNIANDAVTFAKMQNMSDGHFIARNAGGTGDPQQLNATEARALLNVEDGATNVTNTNQLTNGAGFITATLTNEQVQDIVGGMVSGNTESGISVTYQDGDGTLDFSVTSQTDENFTTTLKNKLDGIASGATNVTNNNQITNGRGFTTFDGNYNSLSNRPTIPTNNNQLTNGAGYITAASAPSPAGAAKKWVNFNGNNGTIRDDEGITSVTYHSTGQYTLNFDGNMANTNYSVQGFAFRNGSGRVLAHVDTFSTYTTSALRIMVSGTLNARVVGLSVVNPDNVNISIWGDT